MPKSSKRFTLSDESINRHGFITRTDGIDTENFRKNPALLWMHGRGDTGKKDDVLPLGYWDDIKIENGSITGVPFFDDNDEFAMSIYHKVENGTIRMASAGLVPIEIEEIEVGTSKLRNPSTGQELSATDKVLVLAKSTMQEASLVDIGSNVNCLALYDPNDKIIDLKDGDNLLKLFSKYSTNQPKTTPDMEKVELKALASELNLSADATEGQILKAVQEVKKELADLKLAATKQRNEALVTLAVEKGKITEAMKGHYLTLADSNYEATKSALDALPEYKSVAGQLGDQKDVSADYLKLSWKELDEKGLLKKVKDKHPEIFKLKFKEEFGRDYTG